MNSNSSHRLVARRSDFERPTKSRGKALLVRNRFCGSGSSNEIEKSGTFEVRVQLEKRKARKVGFFPILKQVGSNRNRASRIFFYRITKSSPVGVHRRRVFKHKTFIITLLCHIKDK